MSNIKYLLLFAALSVAFVHGEEKREKRGLGDHRMLGKLGLGGFFGLAKNLGCRMRHWRRVIDANGRPKGCIRRCTFEHSPGYEFKFGHICREKGQMCRGRQWRTVLDINGKPNGCVRRCSDRHVPEYHMYYGRVCREHDFPEGCADITCFRCMKGYLNVYTGLLPGGKCVKKCPEGYVKQRNRCSEPPTGCADMRCSKCQTGYYTIRWSYTRRRDCIKECPLGYGLNEKKTHCILCRVLGCSECYEDGDSCSACHSASFLLKENNTTKCVVTCPAGYERDEFSMTCKKEKKTVVLPTGCRSEDCSLCETGYYKLILNTRSICVKTCPSGYGPLVTLCSPCLTPGCNDCSEDITKCKKCEPGFVSLKDSLNGSRQCLANCPPGTVKKAEERELICVPKTKMNCTVENCKDCIPSDLHSLHKGCIRCEDDYFLKRDIFDDRCLLRCPNGFYEGVKLGTDIKACLNCQIPFCRSCVSPKKCFRCMSPLVLSPKTGLCGICPTGTIYNPVKETCDEEKIPLPIKVNTTEKTTTTEDLSDFFVINKR